MLTGLLKNFLDAENRLTAFPAKRKMKSYALQYLASKFQAGVVYTEGECNQILNEWHTFGDAATLRRELYNGRFIDRDAAGTAYRLADPQPTAEPADR